MGESAHVVYDPRGSVSATPRPLAPRIGGLDGLRLGVLDNSKWNAGKLLRWTVAQLKKKHTFSSITYYKKDNFSSPAAAELIARVAAENDAAVTAVGD